MPWINEPKKKRKRECFNLTTSTSIGGNSMYHTPQWTRLRDMYIHEHPLCERCLANGRSIAAEEVHHKKPFSTGATIDERWSLLLDVNNLMALCKDCHHTIHNNMRRHLKTK